MTHSDDKTAQHVRENYHAAGRPRAANWFWRPWYAKSWWVAAALFWLIILFAPARFTGGSAFAGFVLLFHPFLIVPVLGFGFFKAWIRNNSGAEECGTYEEGGQDIVLFDEHPLQSMDPTNPADSRYYWHPANPASRAWRDRNLWGAD